MPVQSSVGGIYAYNGSLAQLQLGTLINLSLLNTGSGEMTGVFIDDDGVLDPGDSGATTVSLNGGPAQAIDYLGSGWAATILVFGTPVGPKTAMAFAVAGQTYIHFPDGLPALSGLTIAFDIKPGGTFLLRDTMTICFAGGTLIRTASGDRPVQELRAGEFVQTADDGLRPLRWIGSRAVSTPWMRAEPRLRPVVIAQGALGDGLPKRDLTVTQQHRVMLRIEGREVLVAAKHLVGRPGITLGGASAQIYHHLLFDRHQVVLSEGSATESLFLGPMALRSLHPAQQQELALLYPDAPLAGRMSDTARPVLKRRELPPGPGLGAASGMAFLHAAGRARGFGARL